MILEVWALEYGGKIVGLRCKTFDEEYYDLDIDTVLGLGVSRDLLQSLPTLPLMEYGDLLVTQEELENDILVEDGSQNVWILGSLEDFFEELYEEEMLIKKEREKLDALIKKYRYTIYDHWLEEFAWYHLQHFEGNRVYDSLNKLQKEVIQEYFRFRSKEFARHAGRMLRLPRAKTMALLDLMGDANDWEYDGAMDTGYFGGGVCTLGHTLRYMHFAYSPSLDRTIVFGVKCVADFFDLDKQVLSRIMTAQEVVLDEIKIIVFIKNTGKVEEYKKRNEGLFILPELEMYAKEISDPNDRFSPYEWVKLIKKFDACDLPITRAMSENLAKLLYNYRSGNTGEYKGRKVGERIVELPVGYVALDDNLKKKIDFIYDGLRQGKIPSDHFVFKVIRTIMHKKRMSPKQKKFIDEAIDIIERNS